jgi:hypothetical protein
MIPPAETIFTLFNLPGGGSIWIPADVNLQLPISISIRPDLIHYLIYIPWDDKYLEGIDPAYREFFRTVLPYLHSRTTDVHVATCLPFVKELLTAERRRGDERVVNLAFILHDSGWSQMTEIEVANSLGVKGLVLAGTAINPKLRHAELGVELARRILMEYTFQTQLTTRQIDLISQAILYHDRPQQLARMGIIPLELQVVCDVDHLWSFTHANFWQDTARKSIDPKTYLNNLENDLDGYFVSEPAKLKARKMLEQRALETNSWEEWIETH